MFEPAHLPARRAVVLALEDARERLAQIEWIAERQSHPMALIAAGAAAADITASIARLEEMLMAMPE